jgi:hypothetical protein
VLSVEARWSVSRAYDESHSVVPLVDVTVDVPVRSGRPMLTSTLGAGQRCCRRHTDWSTLGEHLIATFAVVPPVTVVRELARARGAAEAFGLPTSDSLDTAELVTRHQLLLLTGGLVENARSDPATGRRRTTSGATRDGRW